MDNKKLLRLEECLLRLESLHLMRWKLMDTYADEGNVDHYIEANEALSEAEHRVWQYQW